MNVQKFPMAFDFCPLIEGINISGPRKGSIYQKCNFLMIRMNQWFFEKTKVRKISPSRNRSQCHKRRIHHINIIGQRGSGLGWSVKIWFGGWSMHVPKTEESVESIIVRSTVWFGMNNKSGS